MVFSTNQVIQFYDLTGRNGETTTATVKSTADGKRHYVELSIGGETFITPTWNVAISALATLSKNDVKRRKAYLVKVNSNAVQAGEHYVLTITYRSAVGTEDTYEKFADYKAGASDTADDILKGIVKSLLANQTTEASALYNLYTTAGVEITPATDISSLAAATGFYIVEPKPDWELGSFPETLEPMEVTANAVDVTGIETEWLLDGSTPVSSLPPVDSSSLVDPIYNTHTVADLEYFAKGERGNSSWQFGWPVNIKPKWNVDADAAYGYHIVTAHVAAVGNNQNSTLQEFDLIFALKDAGSSAPESSIPALMSDLADDIIAGES